MAQMDDDYERFVEALREASASVDSNYFAVPVAGRDDPIVRERAFCYELYHQLRLRLEGTGFSYTLHGEIDKRGHPHFADCVRNKNPDFVVHRPGTLGAEGNLVVIEVKPGTATTKELAEDIEALQLFRDCIEYCHGILLIFGGDHDRVIRVVGEALAESGWDPDFLQILWQPAQGLPAEPITGPWVE